MICFYLYILSFYSVCMSFHYLITNEVKEEFDRCSKEIIDITS